jgi:hypothetical protein
MISKDSWEWEGHNAEETLEENPNLNDVIIC